MWKRHEKIEGRSSEKHMQMFSKGTCMFECVYVYVLVHMGVFEEAKERAVDRNRPEGQN